MTTHHRSPDARAHATRRLAAFAALALAATGVSGACSEAITDPKTPVAISFDSLPAPSVVEGDTLRDPTTGAIVPLNARAYNSKGDTIANAPFTYFVRDTGNPVTVVDGNYLVAALGRRTTAVTLIASLNGLQLTRTIEVVPRPDAIEQVSTGGPQLTLRTPDDFSNVSDDSLTLRVMHDSLGVDSVPVRSWIVRYTVDDSGATLADSVRIVGATTSGTTASAAASPLDTTDASGLASRRVRVFAKANAVAGTFDTVVVSARVTYRGVDVRGSPMRFVVPITR